MSDIKLCECGCGYAAPISKLADNRVPVLRGQPRRFINGHSRRKFRRNGFHVDDATGCWNWAGSLCGYGYGRIVIYKKNHKAHRFIYQWMRGTIPPGLTIDHLCRNKRCVNPDHLEVVTLAENALRCRLAQPGSLTLPQREELKNAYVAGDVTVDILAERYGVDRKTVYNICHSMVDRFHPRGHKLTAQIAKSIRERWNSERIFLEEFARQYGVSEGAVALVLRGKTWKSAGGPTILDDQRIVAGFFQTRQRKAA